MWKWQALKKRLCVALWLGAFAIQAQAAVPMLSIVATPDPALAGSPLLLDVLVTDVSDLYAYQFTLAFDPSVLQATGGFEGSFLATGGATFFGSGSIDNTLGLVSIVFDTLVGAVPGVNGTGVLAHLGFNVIQAGSTALTFSDLLFLDSQIADLTVQAQNGVLLAVPEPASYALLGAGLAAAAGLAAVRRRKAT